MTHLTVLSLWHSLKMDHRVREYLHPYIPAKYSQEARVIFLKYKYSFEVARNIAR